MCTTRPRSRNAAPSSAQAKGWGLTHNGVNLVMSDGSDRLRLLDPATFAERRRIQLTAEGVPVRNLNELEFVKGEIFANIWQTDPIVRIARDGQVVGWIDLSGLLSPSERAGTDVLNGIAYDESKDRPFVTVKLWPKPFEIRLVKKGGRAGRAGRAGGQQAPSSR